MTSLTYPSESFDAATSLWSAFKELLEEDEQTRAIREMWRVLSPAGVGVIEGRPYSEPSEADIKSGARRGPEADMQTLGVGRPARRLDQVLGEIKPLDLMTRSGERQRNPPIAATDIEHYRVSRKHFGERCDDPLVPLGSRPVRKPVRTQLSLERPADLFRLRHG